jgi:hypothetical protein
MLTNIAICCVDAHTLLCMPRYIQRTRMARKMQTSTDAMSKQLLDNPIANVSVVPQLIESLVDAREVRCIIFKRECQGHGACTVTR